MKMGWPKSILFEQVNIAHHAAPLILLSLKQRGNKQAQQQCWVDRFRNVHRKKESTVVDKVSNDLQFRQAKT